MSSNGPQQVLLPPLLQVGNVWFAPQALLAVMMDGYEAGTTGRAIDVLIVGPHRLELIDADADAFFAWWQRVTGQARIQPAPPGLTIAKH